jgi:hypothetical protein
VDNVDSKFRTLRLPASARQKEKATAWPAFLTGPQTPRTLPSAHFCCHHFAENYAPRAHNSIMQNPVRVTQPPIPSQSAPPGGRPVSVHVSQAENEHPCELKTG